MKNYATTKELLEIAYSGDDRIDQEKLFELQEKLAKLALRIAIAEDKTDDLVKSFGWLFERG